MGADVRETIKKRGYFPGDTRVFLLHIEPTSFRDFNGPKLVFGSPTL